MFTFVAICDTCIITGDFVSTQVKTEKNNIGLDWGVYDFRQENNAAKDPQYRQDHWFQRWHR